MDHQHPAPPRRAAPSHPLAPLVLAMLERSTVVDVTDVAITIAGGIFRQSKGRNAYRIVAADVLGYMWHQGVLVRHGQGNEGRPEDGGFWYTVAPSDAYATEAGGSHTA